MPICTWSIAVLPRVACGECRNCQKGRENLCDVLIYTGMVGADGGFAEYAVVNQDNIFPVDDTALMSFIEPLLVGTHASRTLGDNLDGQSILVLGAGGVGISVATVLKHYRQADVTVCDFLPNRLSIAESIGFQTLHQDDITELYDIVIDCAGSDPASQHSAYLDAIGYIYKGGTLLSLGAYFHPVSYVPVTLTFSEINILSSFAYDSTDEQLLPEVLTTIPIDFNKLIEEVSLDDLIEEGYYRSEVDKDSLIRIVARP